MGSSLIYEYIPTTLNIIAFIGASTAFFAASVGLVQNDIKRIIAYSTCSQLGYMVFTCGLSNYNVGVFHLINHAFFKALLFLGAGSIIHAVSDEQDLRKMGGLKNMIPLTYSVIIIGSLALSGCAFLTAFYSTRLIYFVFLSPPNGYRIVYSNVKDSGISISFALVTLTIPSLFFGYYAKDMFIGLGTDFWGNSLFVKPSNFTIIDSEFIQIEYKLLPLILSLCGITFAFFQYTRNTYLLYKTKTIKVGNFLYNFLNKKWFFDKIYNEFVVQSFFEKGFSISYKIIDKEIIEIFGPKGFSNLVIKNSVEFSKFQTSNLSLRVSNFIRYNYYFYF